MISAWTTVLGVMLLTSPDEIVNEAAAAAISADADRVDLSGRTAETKEGKSAKITSETCDYDRKSGVIMFEGRVVVRYSDDYTMCSDRLFMFLSKSNELSRVVAVGGVSITNDTRVGTCAMATYRHRRNEVEMFGADGKPAHLVEQGEDASELEGSRIKFWLDSEQVEVEKSAIKVKATNDKEIL